MPTNLWNDADAAKLPDLGGLVYRSNLLGRDRSVVNIYGGNTSAKLTEPDHLGRTTSVLWVKASGSDVASITERGFAGLRMDEIRPLIGREAMSDDEMVAYLGRCTFMPDRPRQSIETLLHAFLEAAHVDHTHPDAIISLACAAGGRELCEQLWGEKLVWVDYIRPGFTLSKWIGEGVARNPKAELVVMGKHGLTVWGNSSREVYHKTIDRISEAEEFIAVRRAGRRLFASTAVPARNEEDRRTMLLATLPALRGALSARRPAVLQIDTTPSVVEFVGSPGVAQFSQVGAACPDHLVNTKRVPLLIDATASDTPETLIPKLQAGIASYMAEYEQYFERHREASDVMMDPAPRIVLLPGIGMITAGDDALAADVSNQLYQRAIQVIGGSLALSDYTSLNEAEAFAIEYWPLEQYKLKLRPAPRELAGRIAIVTGGASGIGRATARRLAQDGAHVAILDINREGAQIVAEELCKRHGHRRAIALSCNVTSEEAVQRAFEEVVLTYGGIDIVVSNAGVAISAPIEETTVADWDKTFDILAKGYFLVSRAAFRIWRSQRMGGCLIYVASKNSVYAGRGAAAYSAAKAAELHMARCLAEEGGAMGVRVNSVMPDAVLQGSGIWDAGWRAARAAGYGIKPDELEEFYRQRTTLKVNVYPEDIAEAISFFAGPRGSRTTGGTLTVDGGVAAAYLR